MLGTGTQLDPYQITTVSQFRSMNDSTAYFKLMNDLDVNDTQWASGWTEASISFSNFDGDGYEIRNINHVGTSATNAIRIDSTRGTIRNVNFRNFVSIGSNSCFYKQGGYNLHFIDCTFGFDVSVNYIFDIGALVLERCAFTFKGKLNNGFNGSLYAGTSMANSHIKLDGLKIPNNLITISSTRVSVLGSATKDVSGTSRWFNGASQCFVAVDMADSAYRPTAFGIVNPTSPCFYDKDLLGATLTSQTNVHALTTAQCKDKDYLNSIGFLVV